MDVNKFLKKYQNVSTKDLENIREIMDLPVFDEEYFEYKVRRLDERREKTKMKGRAQVLAGPLLEIKSLSVLSNENKSLAVYGRVYGEVCDVVSGRISTYDIYNRDFDDMELLVPKGALTLVSQATNCLPNEACMSLSITRVVVELFQESKNVLINESFSLDETSEDDYEQVKSKGIHGELVSLVIQYVTIPVGVFGRVDFSFYRRRYYNEVEEKLNFIKVYGTVVTRYSNTYGNYASEESILFEKRSHEFEQVDIGKDMHLSKCWVAFPAYSSLVLDVDLSEFETDLKLVKESIELNADTDSSKCFSVNDMIIVVSLSCFSYELEGTRVKVQPDNESSDDEMSSCSIDSQETPEETSDIMQEDIESLNLNLPWALRTHKPWPSPAVEVFSVLIGREKSKALQIYGSIEVLCDDQHIFYIFKRDEKDAMRISEHTKTAPILDDSRYYEDDSPLEMKFNLKDVDDCLDVKGYVDWDAEVLDSQFWRDTQLCSVIRGEHGFAAVHYTIFSLAVRANINVFYRTKMGNGNVNPMVYGNLVAYYNSYDYSSRYKKDYYQILLFKRSEGDAIRVNVDEILTLERSTIIVPSSSSLMIDVDLSSEISNQRWLCTKEIEIGVNSISLEADDCCVDIKLEWNEIK